MTTQRGHRGLNATGTNTKQLYSKCNTCHARLICTHETRTHILRTGQREADAHAYS